MAKRHDIYESFLRQPTSTFNHMVKHHGYLGYRSADIDKAERQKIDEHFAPRRHLPVGGFSLGMFNFSDQNLTSRNVRVLAEAITERLIQEEAQIKSCSEWLVAVLRGSA